MVPVIHKGRTHMPTFNNENLLEMVELYASEISAIDSEEMLSERFDSDILPSVIKQYGADDEVAISEAFNNWSDGLCKDGEIHSQQYAEYCYVGSAS